MTQIRKQLLRVKIYSNVALGYMTALCTRDSLGQSFDIQNQRQWT